MALKDFDAGKVLLSIILSLSGGTLYTVYFLHGSQLSGLATKVDDLTVAIRSHDATVDAEVKSLGDEYHEHDKAIALAEREIEQLKRDPPVIEREVISPPIIRAPAPLPNLGNAIQHLFSPPHHWRGRRP